jgi:hypothetical protein
MQPVLHEIAPAVEEEVLRGCDFEKFVATFLYRLAE